MVARQPSSSTKAAIRARPYHTTPVAFTPPFSTQPAPPAVPAVAYEIIVWTTIPTRNALDLDIYVSWSTGDDGIGDGSIGNPYKTPGRGFADMRNNFGDRLWLKRGDTWSGSNAVIGRCSKSGLSWQRPLVIGSYGTGLEPQLNTNQASFVYTDGADTNYYIILDGFDVNGTQPFNSTQYGISFLGSANHILVQDVKVAAFPVNYRFQGDPTFKHTDITMRGSLCLDANATIAAGTNGSQGCFFSDTNGLLIEFSTFDANGFASALDYTIFRHNVYIQDGCQNVVFRNNVTANGDGVQLKAGGISYGCVYSRCVVSLKDGQGDTPPAGGVTTTVTDSVFFESVDPPAGSSFDGNPAHFDPMNPLRGGQALYLGNLINSTFARLYFLGGTGTDGRVIWVKTVGSTNRALENCAFADLHAHNWGGRFLVMEADPAYFTGSTLDTSSFQSPDNAIFDPALGGGNGYRVIDTFTGFNGTDWAMTRCSFHPNAITDAAKAVNSSMSLLTWFTPANMNATNCSTALVNYPDPNRSMETWGSSIGVGGTHGAAMGAIRGNRKRNWRNDYTAPAILAYVEAGLGITL